MSLELLKEIIKEGNMSKVLLRHLIMGWKEKSSNKWYCGCSKEGYYELIGWNKDKRYFECTVCKRNGFLDSRGNFEVEPLKIKVVEIKPSQHNVFIEQMKKEEVKTSQFNLFTEQLKKKEEKKAQRKRYQ